MGLVIKYLEDLPLNPQIVTIVHEIKTIIISLIGKFIVIKRQCSDGDSCHTHHFMNMLTRTNMNLLMVLLEIRLNYRIILSLEAVLIF